MYGTPLRDPVIIIGAGAAGMMGCCGCCGCWCRSVAPGEKQPSGPKNRHHRQGTVQCDQCGSAAGVYGQHRFESTVSVLGISGFSNQDLMDLLEKQGVPLKVERGERVCPVSDKARDVVDALVGLLRHPRIRLRTGVTVRGGGSRWQEMAGKDR